MQWGPGPVEAGVLRQLTLTKPGPRSYLGGFVKSNQEAESVSKACPSGQETLQAVPQPWVVRQQGGLPACGEEPRDLLVGASNRRQPQEKDCRDLRSSTSPALGSEC